MPMLTNQRWEVYAEERAKGVGKSQSARTAGFSHRSAGTLANKLEHRADVQARIKELSKRGDSLAVAATGISKQWVLTELQYVVKVNTGKTAAVKPLELIGREIGMFQDVIPRQVFDIIMFRMGEALVSLIDDPALLEKIAAKWSLIREQHPLTRGQIAEIPTEEARSIPVTAVDSSSTDTSTTIE